MPPCSDGAGRPASRSGAVSAGGYHVVTGIRSTTLHDRRALGAPRVRASAAASSRAVNSCPARSVMAATASSLASSAGLTP